MATKSVITKKSVLKRPPKLKVTAKVSTDIALTGDALIAFISGAQTNIGKATFYNLKDEQRQAMIDQHVPVMANAP